MPHETTGIPSRHGKWLSIWEGTPTASIRGYAKASIALDATNGVVYYNSGSYGTAVWSGIAAAAGDLDAAFDLGGEIDGCTTTGTAVEIGDGDDSLLIYTNSSVPTITTDGGSNLVIGAAADITIAPTGGDVAVTGTLAVSGTVTSTGDFAVGVNKFNVTAATGATQIDSTLNVDGNLTVGTNKLTVTVGTGALATDAGLTADSLTGNSATTLAIASVATVATTYDAGTTGTLSIQTTGTGNVTIGNASVTTLALVAGTVSVTGSFAFAGQIAAGAGIDMNGTELIMDVNGNSSLHMDTDDQLDVKLGGADEYTFTATSLDLQANKLIFDANANTSITADTDDRFDFEIGGTDELHYSTAAFAFQVATTISTGATTLTLSPTTDVIVANGKGLIVGHTIGGATAQTNEFQVLGTTVADGSMTLGVFSATAGSGPQINFLRSHDAVIIDASFDVVDVNDVLGSITWHCDDGTDYTSVAASIHAIAAVTPAENDTPGILIFSTTADTAQTVTEAVRIDSSQDLRCSAGLIVGSTTIQVTTAQANEFQVLGTAAADSSMTLGCFAASASVASALTFVKSRNATIGSNTIHVDGDVLGSIIWHVADGSDFVSVAASIVAKIDDASVLQDHTGGEILFNVTADGAATVTQCARISSAGDFRIADGRGLIVGSDTAQITAEVTNEVQILGTTTADASLLIGAFVGAASINPPQIMFVKSRAAIGTSTIHVDGDELGEIVWNVGDGNDFVSRCAQIHAEVDDASVLENHTGGALVFSTTADAAATVTENMRIAKDGTISITAGVQIGTDSYIAAGQKIGFDGSGAATYIYETGGVLTAVSDGNIQLSPKGNADTGMVIIGLKTVAGASELHIIGDDDSDDDPGYLVLYDHTGADYYIWVDNTGDLRINSSKPADEDSDGTVVGAQA